MTENAPAPENTPPPAPMVYAGFNIRMLAASIDIALLMLVAAPIVEYLTGLFFGPVPSDVFFTAITAPDVQGDTTKMIAVMWKIVREQHMIERIVIDNALQFLFIGVYTLPFWFRYSTTPGKMLFRLQIVDAATGNRMTQTQAMERFVGYVFSALPLFLGFAWIGFNRQRRGFHDMIARTVVIKKPKKRKALINETF